MASKIACVNGPLRLIRRHRVHIKARLPVRFFCAIFVALSNATFVPSVNQLRFRCNLNVYCNFPQIATKLHQVSNMFEICAISRRRIALKSPLVYTHDVMMELERNKNCIEKCDKSCIKNRMCKRTLKHD